MKKVVLFFLLALGYPLYSQPIIIDNPADYYILDQFFREMITEENFGYVLEEIKPLSTFNIYLSNSLVSPHSRFLHGDVLSKEAIEVWNRIAPEQKNYVFKAVKTFNHKFGGFYYELTFINRSKLEEVIENNLDLFRFHLGPTLESATLAAYIADSPESLDKIVRSNNALIGILLGYGTYNSLMGGREEEIQGAREHLDYPPFLGDHLSQEVREKIDWNLHCFLLSCSDSTIQINEKLFPRPGLCCSSLKEELDKILSRKEEVPLAVLKGRPNFILGAYKNSDNQKLFETVSYTQQQIQTLLARSDLLEYILEKISGEKPLIKCGLSSPKEMRLPLEGNIEQAVAECVWNLAQDLDKETLPIFVDAFCHFKPNKNSRPRLRVLPGVLSGLERAQMNLQVAETQLLAWSKKDGVVEIIPQGIYFECLNRGKGKLFEQPKELLISYVVEDGLGNVLSAEHNCWIDPALTIPGFVYGIKGMCEGEKRKIYVHPAYGYGALTTLSPCVSLIITVTLHEICEISGHDFPSLKPIDLSWLKDPVFCEEVKDSSYGEACYFGHVWGDWLSKSPDVNFSKLCENIKFLADNKEPKISSKNSERIYNRILWNLIVKSLSQC